MRVCDVAGWPPSKYSSAKVANADCPTDEPQEFILESVCFINGRHTERPEGDLVFVIRDVKTGEECTARLRVKDAELGRKLALALGTCRGLSLAQVANVEIAHH